MKIKILGTRGEIKHSHPKYKNHSGVLIDDKLLLDLGEKQYLKHNPKWIFITHLHPDHAFPGFEKEVKMNVPVYSPKNLKSEIKVDGYKIKPIPVRHSKRVESQAYLVEKDGKRFLYTGDLIWIDKKYHHLLGQLDLVITEASFIKKGGLVIKDKKTGQLYGHTGVPNLIRLFKKFTHKIILLHFGSWFYKDIKGSKEKIAQIAKENDIKIIAANDGMEKNV